MKKPSLSADEIAALENRLGGYIPTPLRRRLGLSVPTARGVGPFWSRVDSTPGPNRCWPWVGPLDRYGYGFVSRQGRAHRLAWQLHHGSKLTPGDVIRHACDNPVCCNPAHLKLGSQTENVQDRVERGRSARGALNGRAKLTASEAKMIYRMGGTAVEVAARFGVDPATIRGIRNGRSWSWATGHIPTTLTSESNKKTGYILSHVTR